MQVTIWGARGSIPTPLLPEQVEQKIIQAITKMPALDTTDAEAVTRYVRALPPLQRGTAGGNTTCIQIQAGPTTMVVDAGSGIRELAQELMKGPCGQGKGAIHLFFSHPHWDHIQGFPFFLPAYVPGNRIRIYSVHDLRSALIEQQRSIYFPVLFSEMAATIEYVQIDVDKPFTVGDVTVRAICNVHPGKAYSLRFDDRHNSFVVANDAEYKELTDASVQPFINFCRDADALLFDAQFTLNEVWDKEDWGHSSALIGVDLARAAGVKKLLLAHHNPYISDQQLEEAVEDALQYQEQRSGLPRCEVVVAYEGLTLDLTSADAAAGLRLFAAGDTTVLMPTSVFDERSVEVLKQQLRALTDQQALTYSIIDLSSVEILTTAGLKALVDLHREWEAAQLVLACPSPKVRNIIELSGYLDYFAIYPTRVAAFNALNARAALNLPGHIIDGRYLIQEHIERYPLVVTLVATDLKNDRKVFVNSLSPSLSHQLDTLWLNRAHKLRQIQHRHLVNAVDVYTEDARTFLIEEAVEGATLAQIVQDAALQEIGDAAEIEFILEIVDAITAVLEYGHGHGLIHGNLRLENIYVSGAGIKLGGYGMALLEAGRKLTEANPLFLDIAYLAPEQILGQPLDARTDLYTLGVVLYRLLTEQMPFSGSGQQIIHAHLEQPPVPLRELNPDISIFVEHLVMKLLAKQPRDRYDSVSQVRHIVRGLVNAQRRSDAATPTTLVGRKRGLHILQALLDDTRAGAGQLAFVFGESGIGKTSLLQHFAAQGRSVRVMSGSCSSMRGSPAFQPFLDAMRGLLRDEPLNFARHIMDDALDDEALVAQGLDSFARDMLYLFPELADALPTFDFLSTSAPAETPMARRNGNTDPGEKRDVSKTLIQFLARATYDRTCLLILEDLHWADQSTLQLLKYLGYCLSDIRLLIIGTYDDTRLHMEHPLRHVLRDLSHHCVYYQIALERMNAAEIGQVLANTWPQAAPPALAQEVHRLSEGNPLFAIQFGKALLEDDSITMSNGEWRFPAVRELRAFSNVSDAIWRRIRLLNPDTQSLLRQSSVIGDIFLLQDLCELSGLSVNAVLDLLDAAIETGIVQQMPGNNALGFTHYEIRAALYTDIGPAARQKLHAQVGNVLELRANGQQEAPNELLAHHFTQAGNWKKALFYSARSAQRAALIHATEQQNYWEAHAQSLTEQIRHGQSLPGRELSTTELDRHGAKLEIEE
ncbi:MAG: AAA family ATPase [Caldilineaceae bacterium]